MSDQTPSRRLFALVTGPGEDIYRSGDLLDIAHAMRDVEAELADVETALMNVPDTIEGYDSDGIEHSRLATRADRIRSLRVELDVASTWRPQLEAAQAREAAAAKWISQSIHEEGCRSVYDDQTGVCIN